MRRVAVTKYLTELVSSGDGKTIQLPEGVQARDDEQALYTLLQSNFNVEEAVRRKKLQTTPPTGIHVLVLLLLVLSLRVNRIYRVKYIPLV